MCVSVFIILSLSTICAWPFNVCNREQFVCYETHPRFSSQMRHCRRDGIELHFRDTRCLWNVSKFDVQTSEETIKRRSLLVNLILIFDSHRLCWPWSDCGDLKMKIDKVGEFLSRQIFN